MGSRQGKLKNSWRQWYEVFKIVGLWAEPGARCATASTLYF